MLLSISAIFSSVLRSHVPQWPFRTQTTWAQQGWIRTTATKSSCWRDLPTMFQNARNFKIIGGALTVNEQNGLTGALYECVVNRYLLTSVYACKGLQILHRYVWDRAAHYSAQHAPVCHLDTCKTIIGEIMGWIRDSPRRSSILWFNGPAGASKTAIAQSLCNQWKWPNSLYRPHRLAA